jgi:hypothetical protein
MISRIDGQEAGCRGRAEDQEVVHRLRLGTLRRAVTRRHQGRGADKQEVPPDSIEGQRNPEVPRVDPMQRDQHAKQQDQRARPHHRQHAEAIDQVSRVERRNEHAHHMQEDYPMRLGVRQAAPDDRQR